MRDAGTVLAAIGFLLCGYFVVTYHWLTGGDWRRNPGGRHLMEFTANLGLLLGLIVLARFWPDYPGRDALTLLVFGGLVAQVLWRIVLLHRVQDPDQQLADRR
ncbi:putative phage holin [Micromonospora chalcea]|uniref:putative phage holin n=1 Tax=Micromonospora chalcea TaxID=1874 RepID=UPI0021A8954B|nr:hypothetical protein [Micromonospora chalcea]MCT2279314.1 hypothetical protein [Micromonospora chalcea]